MTEIVELDVAEYGDADGRPIVALHGGNATKEQWERFGDEGFPDRRWICPDLRGHGRSPSGGPPWSIALVASDVMAALDARGVAEFDVLGASLGGRVAAEIARHSPSRVRSVAMLDPSLWLPREHERIEEHLRTRGGKSSSTSPREFDTIDQAVEYWTTHHIPADAKVYAERELRAALEPVSNGRFRLRANPALVMSLLADLRTNPMSFGAFTGRVLLLVAKHFEAVTEAGERAIRAELGDRLDSVTLDAGHVLTLEAFDQTVGHISTFLEREAKRESFMAAGRSNSDESEAQND